MQCKRFFLFFFLLNRYNPAMELLGIAVSFPSLARKYKCIQPNRQMISVYLKLKLHFCHLYSCRSVWTYKISTCIQIWIRRTCETGSFYWCKKISKL